MTCRSWAARWGALLLPLLLEPAGALWATQPWVSNSCAPPPAACLDSSWLPRVLHKPTRVASSAEEPPDPVPFYGEASTPTGEVSAPRAVPGLTLRPARFGDLGEVAVLLVRGFYGADHGWSVPLCLRELQRLQGKFTYTSEDHVMLVAESDPPDFGSNATTSHDVHQVASAWPHIRWAPPPQDRESAVIVGFVDIDRRPPKRPHADDAPRPYISDLTVCLTHRRKGIARALMLRCEAVCRGWGYEWAYIKSESTNEPAMAAYTSLGYEADRRFSDGKVLLRKSLAEP